MIGYYGDNGFPTVLLELVTEIQEYAHLIDETWRSGTLFFTLSGQIEVGSVEEFQGQATS